MLSVARTSHSLKLKMINELEKKRKEAIVVLCRHLPGSTEKYNRGVQFENGCHGWDSITNYQSITLSIVRHSYT
jgi:hypothetical protein